MALGQLLLTRHFHLQAKPQLVPGQPDIGEAVWLVGAGEVLKPARFGQVEQPIAVLLRNIADVHAGMSDTNQESSR